MLKSSKLFYIKNRQISKNQVREENLGVLERRNMDLEDKNVFWRNLVQSWPVMMCNQKKHIFAFFSTVNLDLVLTYY